MSDSTSLPPGEPDPTVAPGQPPITPPPAVPPTPPVAPPEYAAAPPSPPPVAGPSSHAASPAPGSAVNVGAAFSWAIAKFQQYAGILIGLAAVVFVIRLIQIVISNAIFNSLNDCSNAQIIVTDGGVVGVASCGVGLVTSIGVNLIISLLFSILIALATIGIYRAALKTSRGEAPSFDHLTSSENLGAYIAVAIVYFLASLGGLILCVLPGLVVIFLFQFAPFFALDRGEGISAAFGNSYRAVTANFVPVLLTALINIVAAFLSGILFGLLTLVLLPFSALFTVHIYRQLNHEEIAA